mgnify:FL=1
MSAEIKRLIPEGLKHYEAERSKPRHDPPLRFCPSKTPENEDGDDDYNKSITVELNQKTTMKVLPYTFQDVESFLVFQKQHVYILAQQEAEPNWSKFEKILNDTVIKLTAISPNTINKTEKASRKKLEELQETLKKRMGHIMTKAFTLYQQMCGPALRAEWDDIVVEHCFSKDWLDSNNLPSTEERGQSWTTLAEAKRLHLLTVCDADAAERHDQYMNVTLMKPRRLSIKPFYKRVKELDELAPHLPCLKDQPDCPKEVERRNLQMTPFAMCGLLMRNVSIQMEDEYNCLHENVPTDPKKLVDQLTRIETKVRSVAVEKKKARNHEEKQGEDPQGSRNAKKRANKDKRPHMDQPIPRKPPTRDKKLCKLCEEFGGSKNTHTTAQCKKWVSGGKHHNEWRGPKANTLNAHASDTSVNQLMAQQAEFQKTIMKQMSKMSSKKKKSKRHRYSSSESDSD